MTATDRMGGFIAARVIEIKNIESFVIIGKNASIELKPGNTFFEIDVKKNGISPVVSLAREKSGHIFEINLSLSSKTPIGLKLKPFNKMVAICTNPMGESFVFGTPSFPLSGSIAPVLSDRADGGSGELLSLIGRQPLNILNLARKS